jgi:hypothetical protein
VVEQMNSIGSPLQPQPHDAEFRQGASGQRLRGLTFLLILAIMTFSSWPVFAQIASSLLNPLLAAWIRSEVENVDNLQVQVSGSDQEIFNGVIKQANVSGSNVLYQGYRVTQLALNGQNIRLNVNEAIQGKKQLQLMAPVPVQIDLRLTEADLNQTLQSPSIQSQLATAKVKLPIGGQAVPFLISEPQVKLETGRIHIQAKLATPDGAKVPVTLTTGLQVQDQNQLLLKDPQWVSNGQSIPIPGLNQLEIELGDDVRVNQLDLQQGQILYKGNLTIQPEELTAPQG